MSFLKTLKGEILHQLSLYEDATVAGEVLRNNCKVYFRNRSTNKGVNDDLVIQFSKRCIPKNGLQEVLELLANAERPMLLMIEEWKIVTPLQLAAKLRRNQVIATVLEEVYNSGSRYGFPVSEKKVVVWNSSWTALCDAQDLSVLRLCYVHKHVYNLLTACCSSVVFSNREESQQTKDTAVFKLEFTGRVRNSRFVGKKSENDVASDSSCISTCGTFIYIKQYLEANCLSCEELGFDNSVDSVLVLNANDTWSLQFKEVFELELTNKARVASEVPDTCVFLTPCNSAFITQQIILMWRAIGQYCPRVQRYCVVGPVLPLKTSTLPSTTDFKNAIMADLEAASAHKYGSAVGSQEWKQMLEPMAEACIKYNLFSTSLQQPVKLEIDNDSSLRSVKSGSFVLYNYARLSTLLDQFDKSVQEGKYPEMPSVCAIDWCVLRKEGEWGLLLHYIAHFPVLIDEIVAAVLNNGRAQVKFPIHRLYLFLLNLSHDVSTYYSAVHVLGNPLPHLLPQMFARLHLLRAIHQIMKIIFSVLDITPLRQM